MGRPTKCNPQIAEEIAAYINEGTSNDSAARLAGICPKTFYNWLERGEKDENPFSDFLHIIKKAHAAFEKQMTSEIKAGVPNWQSRAWLLERKYPDKYGQRTRHEVTGKDGGPLVIVNWDDGEEK